MCIFVRNSMSTRSKSVFETIKEIAVGMIHMLFLLTKHLRM